MAKKKDNKTNAESTSDDIKLVAKVDEMMATKNQDMTPDYEQAIKSSDAESEPSNEEEATTETKTEVQPEEIKAEDMPPLDIFADVPGAPPLEDKEIEAVEIKPKKPKSNKKATKISIKEYDNEPESEDEAETGTEDKAEVEPEEEEEKVEPVKKRPPAYDDSVISKAIDDIVAHEGDVALMVQDQQQASSEGVAPTHSVKRTHHIFWTFVALVCLVAVAMTIFIINPSVVRNPLHSLHWNSIKKHL